MRSTDEASPTQVSRVLVCRIRDIRPREGNRRPHHNIDFRHPSHSHPQPAEPRSRPSVWRQLNLGYFRNPKVVGLDRYSKYFFLIFLLWHSAPGSWATDCHHRPRYASEVRHDPHPTKTCGGKQRGHGVALTLADFCDQILAWSKDASCVDGDSAIGRK